jgi:hypothetical protein
MAEDDKVADNKQCEETAAQETAAQKDRPRQRDKNVLPGILGKQLRAAYGELLNAPVPDAITDLIKRLENQEANASKAPQQPRREEQGQ